MQRFREQRPRRNDQSDKHIIALFEYFQIKSDIQTARESHDLKMDFRLFVTICIFETRP